MNRKRLRKDISCVKKHLSHSVVQEPKFVHNFLNTTVSSNCDNYEYLENNSMINSDIVDKHNEILETESDIYMRDRSESNASIKYENEQLSELDSEQSSTCIPHESTSYVVSENTNTTNNDFKRILAVWATEHQISYTALTALLQKLKQHSCFSKLSLMEPKPIRMKHTIRKMSGTHYLQCTENLSNSEQRNDNEGNNILVISTPNFNEVLDPQCIENLSNAEHRYYNEDNVNVSNSTATNNRADSDLNYEQKSKNFQRFVIQKLIDLELKMNCINTNQKHILEKLSIDTFETEKREKIDIFQDLPLKDEKDLEVMETKLKNDLFYRNQMIKQLARVTCQKIKMSCLQLMKLILSNELAMNYSWYGAKKKRIFSKLTICEIIMTVIRKSHADVKDEQISAPIKIWLAHAKERMERGHRNVLL